MKKKHNLRTPLMAPVELADPKIPRDQTSSRKRFGGGGLLRPALQSSGPPSHPWCWLISAQLSLPLAMDTNQRKVCRVWCYFRKLLLYICMEHWVKKGLGNIHIKLTGSFLSNYLRRMVEEKFGRSFTHSFKQICINLIIYILKFLEFLFLLLPFIYNSWNELIHIKVQKS